MNLGPNDRHFVFDNDTDLLKGYDCHGREFFRAECRNVAVGGDGFGHFGRCPRGDYEVGSPIRKGTAPFGEWFVPLLDYGAHHTMAEFERSGIGVHGGGSGLANPFSAHQGWVPTHGCLRLQNSELSRFVLWVRQAQAKGGKVYVSVCGE